MDKRDELLDIAQQHGMQWEVLTQATRNMEDGQDELQALINACIDWDIL